ncbi:hypothetical protein [Calidifontibacillus oryziterrae]|uniref:hypothetical protein n=1 Tax=Calidifontibacillus oryziterrae TaxID=1191699 RepID=UPI0003044C8C|nr:hypothetical protein [Calidifontibacillus oryziterrae]
MNDTIVYSLEDIRIHVEDLIEEFDFNCSDYENEMNRIKRKAKDWKVKKTIRRIRLLAYAINGHYIDIVETLKKCNDYLYLNNHLNSQGYSNMALVDLEEFKDIRRNIKKTNKDKINKLYRKSHSLKNERNKTAHTMCELISTFLIENKVDILDSLNQYLELLNKVAKNKNDIKKREKHKQSVASQLDNIKKIIDGDIKTKGDIRVYLNTDES